MEGRSRGRIVHGSPYSPYATPRQTSSLCDLCQKIFASWSKALTSRSLVFKHYRDPVDVMSSANSGCILCAQFHQDALNRAYSEDAIDNVHHGIVMASYLSHDLCQHALMYKSRGEWIEMRIHESSVTMVRSNTRASLPFYENNCSWSTLDALPLCLRWMAKCLHSHQKCNVSSSIRIPTRLISLGDACIKLCLSSEINITPKYATLNHCWGNLPFTTLTSTNYEAFRHSIPLENIPKTFVEAIFVVRELGFQYLWIDSLCIVQDDSDDWTAESSLMSDVYGNSAINIAASSAINGSVGLFFNRDPTWKCYIQTTSSGDDNQFWDCVPGTFNTILQDSPLSTRGWALQERVLPRRTIHFTNREVFWECDELVACETFPDGIPSAAPFYHLQKRPMDYETWSGLVERYSRCKLTHQTDKLVAISGLARISQSEMNDEYVAGLWKGDLELQLGWYALNPVPRTDPYVAPTWSWASLDAPIELARQDLRSGEDLCIEVADIQITHASSDIHGEVRSANLLLSCKFILRCVIKLENPGEKSAFIDIGKGTIKVKVMLGCLRLGDWQDHATYLVPIKVLKDANKVSGLLLLRIDGTNGRYIRLGVFKTASRYYRNILKQALLSPSKQIEREAYIENTWDAKFKKRYTISIA